MLRRLLFMLCYICYIIKVLHMIKHHTVWQSQTGRVWDLTMATWGGVFCNGSKSHAIRSANLAAPSRDDIGDLPAPSSSRNSNHSSGRIDPTNGFWPKTKRRSHTPHPVWCSTSGKKSKRVVGEGGPSGSSKFTWYESFPASTLV